MKLIYDFIINRDTKKESFLNELLPLFEKFKETIKNKCDNVKENFFKTNKIFDFLGFYEIVNGPSKIINKVL